MPKGYSEHNQSGWHHSKEAKAKISCSAIGKQCGEKNPFYGKRHTGETKQKLRELSSLGIIGRKGHKNSPDHNARISASNKIAYQDPAVRERCRATMLKLRQDPKWLARSRERHKTVWQRNKHPSLGKKRTAEQRRRMSLAHIGVQAGVKHPRWLGGITLEPYGIGWTVARRKLVKERDFHTCQLCLTNSGSPMDVHHIDYNKKNNDFSNWITLCHKCNARVNLRRGFWQAFFEQIRILKLTRALPS